MDTFILLILTGVAVCCLFLLVGIPFQRRRPRVFRDDAATQLRHVMDAPFYKKKIMTKAEYRVFKTVEDEISRLRNGCRVLSQTSLGEIIGSENKRAFFAINDKRVDVLVINSSGDPVAAFEHQGPGHHQGNAAARDAIKREALRRAGVVFIEVLDTHSCADVALQVRRLFQHKQAA